MALDFNKYAQAGNEFLNQLAKQLNTEDDLPRTGRMFKAIIHTIRELLSPEENVQLLAQLPMFLKGVYVDSWSISKDKKHPQIKHFEDFEAEVRRFDERNADHDFPNEGDIEHATLRVFQVLRKYISLGEFEDIKASLPKEIKPLLNEVLMI